MNQGCRSEDMIMVLLYPQSKSHPKRCKTITHCEDWIWWFAQLQPHNALLEKGKGVGVFRSFPPFLKCCGKKWSGETLPDMTFVICMSQHWEAASYIYPCLEEGWWKDGIFASTVFLDCSIPTWNSVNRTIFSVLLGFWIRGIQAGHSPRLSRVIQTMESLMTQDNTPFHKTM